MPVNWYAALVFLVIAGLASIVIARIDYRHGPVTNTTPPLKGGSPWFAAVTFDVCGTQRAPLPSNALATATQSFFTTGNGVIAISPKKTSDAGDNAVFGKFVSSYHGLTLTSTELQLPASTASKTSTSGKTRSSKTSKSTTYRNGDKCPAGTKYAGKKGEVKVTYWSNAFSSSKKSSTVQGNPGTLRFTNDQLITVGFVPAGTTLPKPNGAIVTALLNASSTTTTPTTAPSTTTSAPSTTSTTTSSTTSTTAPSATSTTAPSSSTTSTTKAG